MDKHIPEGREGSETFARFGIRKQPSPKNLPIFSILNSHLAQESFRAFGRPLFASRTSNPLFCPGRWGGGGIGLGLGLGGSISCAAAEEGGGSGGYDVSSL